MMSYVRLKFQTVLDFFKDKKPSSLSSSTSSLSSSSTSPASSPPSSPLLSKTETLLAPKSSAVLLESTPPSSPSSSIFPQVKESENPDYRCFFLTHNGLRGRDNTSIDLVNILNPVAQFINEAKHSLDLCFYLITDYIVVEAIIKAKQRNVAIRLITDFSSGIVNNKYSKNFYAENIPIYARIVSQEQTIMHNKFCIRDGNTVLQASMNLTKNTSKGSYDNVIITDDFSVVKKFEEQFNYLINRFTLISVEFLESQGINMMKAIDPQADNETN